MGKARLFNSRLAIRPLVKPCSFNKRRAESVSGRAGVVVVVVAAAAALLLLLYEASAAYPYTGTGMGGMGVPYATGMWRISCSSAGGANAAAAGYWWWCISDDLDCGEFGSIQSEEEEPRNACDMEELGGLVFW
jgi:hypothetical protein